MKFLPQIFCLILFGLGVYFIPTNVQINKAQSDSVVKIEPIYAADFSNDKILMGASHNVFVGKVLEQVGTKERGIGPETQFSVEVVENIKGDLKGNVVVNQEGGYKDGVLYVLDDERNSDTLSIGKASSYLLQPGSTYLFATRYNEKENWYTLNSFPTASKLLSKENLSGEQLKSLAVNDTRVKELQEAYKNEVPLDADVKNNNTLNSYKSVQEKPVKEEETIPSEVKPADNANTEKIEEQSDSTDSSSEEPGITAEQ